jgi:hypothetical protein
MKYIELRMHKCSELIKIQLDLNYYYFLNLKFKYPLMLIRTYKNEFIRYICIYQNLFA